MFKPGFAIVPGSLQTQFNKSLWEGLGHEAAVNIIDSYSSVGNAGRLSAGAAACARVTAHRLRI
jgi:hypothetical protein